MNGNALCCKMPNKLPREFVKSYITQDNLCHCLLFSYIYNIEAAMHLFQIVCERIRTLNLINDNKRLSEDYLCSINYMFLDVFKQQLNKVVIRQGNRKSHIRFILKHLKKILQDQIAFRRTQMMDSAHSVAISGHQITFQFQLGLVRDRVTVDSNELNLNSLKVSPPLDIVLISRIENNTMIKHILVATFTNI